MCCDEMIMLQPRLPGSLPAYRGRPVVQGSSRLAPFNVHESCMQAGWHLQNPGRLIGELMYLAGTAVMAQRWHCDILITPQTDCTICVALLQARTTRGHMPPSLCPATEGASGLCGPLKAAMALCCAHTVYTKAGLAETSQAVLYQQIERRLCGEWQGPCVTSCREAQ